MAAGLLLVAAACGGDDAAEQAEDEPAATASEGAPDDAPPAGNPDRDFLREMTNHHHGMVAMVHGAMEKRGSAVQGEAAAIDQQQDEEIERMMAILLRDFSDSHTPTIDPATQTMIETLSAKIGADFDMSFRMNVVEHHKQGIAMIDRFLPTLTREDIRTMARRMKYEQEGEIRSMLAKMGH